MSVIYEPKGRAREYAPLAANLYRGCRHGCTYCYAPNAIFMKREEFHTQIQPKKDVLKKLEKQLKTGAFKGKRVLMSFTSDPYQAAEYSHRLTYQAMLLFLEHGVNWEILTKAGQHATRDFGMYRKGDRFGASLTFIDMTDSHKYEPEADFPFHRMGALRLAHEMGIPNWVSLEPVIDPAQTLDLIRATHMYVDEYRVGKINYQESCVDWRKFTHEAVEMLERLGKKYIIKDSLKEYMP